MNFLSAFEKEYLSKFCTFATYFSIIYFNYSIYYFLPSNFRVNCQDFVLKGKGRSPRSKKSTAATADGPSAVIRTAEVTLDGLINGQAFQVTRRRSAKKSELFFTLDGRNMTTQSVKDTQILMVLFTLLRPQPNMKRQQFINLGRNFGHWRRATAKVLLFRATFAHSPGPKRSQTLNLSEIIEFIYCDKSLLGLTDVKLKNELSALVDTAIWGAALQTVKAQDRADKQRLSEISIEHRLRSEELKNLQLTYNSTLQTKEAISNDLFLAKVRFWITLSLIFFLQRCFPCQLCSK